MRERGQDERSTADDVVLGVAEHFSAQQSPVFSSPRRKVAGDAGEMQKPDAQAAGQ